MRKKGKDLMKENKRLSNEEVIELLEKSKKNIYDFLNLNEPNFIEAEEKMNKIDYELIPEHMMLSIKGYVDRGEYMGGFLTSVFSNDLFKAVSKADEVNINLIPTYVSYIFCELPANCHGSLEIVKNYANKKQKEKKDEHEET